MKNSLPYFVSWSGGKDSYMALSNVFKNFDKPKFLLTMLTEAGERSRSHGLKKAVLQAQADALEIPILFYNASWENYENTFISALNGLKAQGINAGVFGDIQLSNNPTWDSHREWADSVCRQANMVAYEPLWGKTTDELLADLFNSGIKAEIIAVKSRTLGKKYLGQRLTPSLIQEITPYGIDPLGEQGEYHTIVLDGPLFSRPLSIKHNKPVLRGGYWFLDVDVMLD